MNKEFRYLAETVAEVISAFTALSQDNAEHEDFISVLKELQS
jgi:hypothetical protein